MPTPVDTLLAALSLAASATSVVTDSLTLADKAGLSGKIATLLDKNPPQVSFSRALDRAHARFSRLFPDMEASLFDRQLLKQCVDLLLANATRPANLAEVAGELVSAWCNLMPSEVTTANYQRVREAASEFVVILEEELLEESAYRAILEAHYAKDTSETNRQLVGLLSEIKRDLVDASAASIMNGDSRINEVQLYEAPFDDEVYLVAPDPFFGREYELGWLKKRLTGDLRDHKLRFSGLYGLSGIGKTAVIAKAVAQLRAERRFKDGVAVINCSSIIDAGEISRRVLARFDVHRRPPVLTDSVQMSDACRRLLKGKDVLIVLDDLEPTLPLIEALAPLRAVGVRVVVTARHTLRIPWLPMSSSRKLAPLPKDQGAALFASSLGDLNGSELRMSDRHEINRIVEALDGHPLAIRVAGAYASATHRDYAVLAREIQDLSKILDLEDLETTRSVAQLIMRSMESLPADSRKLLCALSRLGTSQFSRNVARAIGNELLLEDVDSSIDMLIVRGLAEAAMNHEMPDGSDRERVHLHTLIRAAAMREFEQSLADVSLADVLDKIEEVVAQYFREYVRHVDPLALGVDEGNVNAALDWAQAHSRDEILVDLCKGMRSFWRFQGGIISGLHYLPMGIAAAQRCASQATSVTHDSDHLELQLLYGNLLMSAGDVNGAEQMFVSSLSAWEERGDKVGQSAAHVAIARVAQHHGQLGVAQEHLFRALELDVELQDLQGLGVICLELGATALLAADVEGAETCFGNGLAIMRIVDDKHQIAVALAGLAQVARYRSRLDEAEHLLQSSLVIRREVGDVKGEEADLITLGQIERVRGRLTQAEDYLNQALPVAEKLRAVTDQATIYSELGHIAFTRHNHVKAGSYFETSLALEREVQHRRGEAISVHSLGLLALDKGEITTARKLFEQAIDLSRSVADQDTAAAALDSLGKALCILGELEKAELSHLDALEIHRAMADPSGEALSLAGLSMVAGKRRQYDTARQYLLEALEYAQLGSDLVNHAHGELMLGSLLANRMGLLEEGRHHYLRGLAELKQLGIAVTESERRVAQQLGCDQNT